jgi:hypothetical protein
MFHSLLSDFHLHIRLSGDTTDIASDAVSFWLVLIIGRWFSIEDDD